MLLLVWLRFISFAASRFSASGPRGQIWLLAGVLLTLSACSSSEAPPGAVSGTRVTSVFPTGVGDLHGLRVGDVVLAADSGDRQKAIRSAIDIRRVEAEWAPRGDVRLRILRDGREEVLKVPSGLWEVVFEGEDEIDETAVFRQESQTDQLNRAAVWQIRGMAALRTGDRKVAAEAFTQALEIRRASAVTLGVASTLIRLADVLPERERRPHLEEAQALWEEMAPEGLDMAHALNGLGIVAGVVDQDLDRAIELYQESLAIRLRVIPTSHRVAGTLSNLSRCARLQGRLDDAQDLLQRSLTLLVDAPDLRSRRAGALNDLGRILRDRGEFGLARESFEESLAVFRQLDPEGPAVAGMTNNLGTLARWVGDFEEAESRYRAALQMRRRIAPGSRAVAASLNNLGSVALGRETYDDALAWLEEALELKQANGGDPLSLANTHLNLGEAFRGLGRLEESEASLRKALELQLPRIPDSTTVAENRIALGAVMLLRGDTAGGLAEWRAGLEQIDRARLRFRWSPLERSVFASRFQDHYRRFAVALAKEGQIEEAFEIVERSKARALRTLVAGDGSSEGRGEEVPSLGWRDVQQQLPGGTLLLEFSIAEGGVLLFAGTRDGLEVHETLVQRKELERKVDLFRQFLARGRVTQKAEPALIRLSAALWNLLLEPVADRLSTADLMVIVPDRPLTTLPFEALVTREDPLTYLGQEKALVYSVSATTHLGLGSDGSTAVSMLGPVPRIPWVDVFARSEGEAGDGTRGVVRAPLPGAAEEGQRLAEIFGDRAQIWLDGQARESVLKERFAADRAQSRTPGGFLHFAAHGEPDERRPLRSALFLAAGEGEDGALTASEILDELQISARLVSLAACETGLGRDLGGDGVIGLLHAFQSVGAEGVLASSWKVSDLSAATWMESFYRRLEGGASLPDSALDARLRVLETIGLEHPYHWAAFQLWGR